MMEEVSDWWKQALRDLESARNALRCGDYYVSAFLSQQAVEKALKALYILKFNDLWKIHDLVRLARKVDAPHNIVELCAKITPGYMATRYPDVGRKYDRGEVEGLLVAAKEVLDWVKKNLNS
ncbi:MAG: HEPN domain-containing protein [Methanosarcinales archaeon Met12]|nr:MAG: HEPN domain-containing protein [Methanosarcinales archaeon Met12]